MGRRNDRYSKNKIPPKNLFQIPSKPDARKGVARYIRPGATREPLVRFEEALVGSDYSEAESAFLLVVQRYQKEAKVRFISTIEIFRLMVSLGYVLDPSKAFDHPPTINDFVENPGVLWENRRGEKGERLKTSKKRPKKD